MFGSFGNYVIYSYWYELIAEVVASVPTFLPPTTFTMSSSTALATISAVQFLRVDSYVNLACLTFLAYDTCLGFSEELEHVWRARWTLPKFLYLFMRYYSLAHLLITFCVNIRTGLPENFCSRYIWYWSMGGAMLFQIVIDIIYLLRLHALYGHSRKVLVALTALVLGNTTTGTLMSALIVHNDTLTPSLNSPIPGCRAKGHLSKLTLVAWLPSLLVSVVFFAMTLIKFVELAGRDLKSKHKHTSRVWSYRRLSPLLATLVQDGTIFFFATLTITLACTSISTTIQGALRSVLIPFNIAVNSYSGCHLILNLRVVADKKGWAMTGFVTAELRRFSEVQFDEFQGMEQSLSIKLDEFSR